MRGLSEQDIIEDILDEFDFSKVQQVMEHLDWTWHDSDGVPTLGQLRKAARSLMKICIDYEEYTTASGGFWVQKRTFDGDPFYRLMFVVAEWDNHN